MVAVHVFNGNFLFLAHFNGSGVAALHEAVAVADDGGNRHAAQEAQMGVAQLHSSIASHVAAQLFLIHSAVHVGRQFNAAQVALRHVQRHELDIGVVVLHFGDSAAKGITGHHDHVVAFFSGLFDHGHTLGGGVASGLEVGEINAVLFRPLLAGFVGSLVEGLVGDIAVVGDHRHAHRVFSRRDRNHRQNHDERQDHCQELFHELSLL